MGLKLNQMIEAALLEGQAGAMQKLAQEAEGENACEKCGRPAVPGAELCKACADAAAKKEEAAAATGAAPPGESGPEKTSSDRVEKLASAVEYIDHALSMGRVPAGRIKTAMPEEQVAGVGIGPNTLPNNMEGMPTEKMPAQIGGSGATSVSIPTSPPQEAGANPKAAQSSMGTDKDKRPGGNEVPGSGLLGSKPGVMVQPGGGSPVAKMKQAMLRKIAAPGTESAMDGTTASITTPKTSALPEDQPSQVARPAEVTSQERMIASNESAIGFTKRDAKAVPKKRMGEVLDEPAQSKAGDSALQDALGAELVSRGGAKIASAQHLVQKIASEGCTCDRDGLVKNACDHCRIASKMERMTHQRAGAGAAAVRGTSGAAR